MLIALLLAQPFLGGFESAFQTIQEYTGFVAPGVVAVFLLGVFAGGKRPLLEPHLPLWRRLEVAARRLAGQAVGAGDMQYGATGPFALTHFVRKHGLLGRVHYGEVDYYHGIGPWYGQFRWNVRRDGGGTSLLSAGCHALDALRLCHHSISRLTLMPRQ